ncbi:unnamed protein product (macronuclear) [Paramecium tetraurelia]|uniref:Uncharacterized protein n=1 Tax=Paramecium tetraurelia TaxID=5888 RepID=A0C6L9_PARTE|nr:uncharacterized protein GSPATT00035565001 [Paramecium tetraurelia]CAK66436.1 unnamed protein product [Paramecium tetraurelia]|eukprot:XP_001433833.1 hypothetical protein (macronuclear) [Paramecium tetraurelia strain d4-2]
MNQTQGFTFKKRQSHPEQEITNTSLKIQENQTTKKLQRKQSRSQEDLAVFLGIVHPLCILADEYSLDDGLSQIECNFNTMTSLNYQQMPSLLSIYTSESNLSIEEEFEIWDDKQDLRVLKIILEDQLSSTQQFLLLYKARFGGFPGQQQCIKNEEVIQTAVKFASSSKQQFKKYFPSKKIVFEDDIDYSVPYKIEDDHHFQSFNHFFKFQKTKTQIDF